MNTTLIRHLVTVAVLGGLALSPDAGAQNPTWVSLSSSQPPGTPAEIVYDASASSATDSVFDIFVHGYWSETIAPGDGFSYERVTVPGLGRLGVLGAPDLPTARLEIAVATGAANVDVVSVNDLDPRSFPGLRPYPYEIQELDEAFDPTFAPGEGDPDGTPSSFFADPAIYGGTAPYPAAPSVASAATIDGLGKIPATQIPVIVASWDPTSGLFSISAHTRVHAKAAGSPSIQHTLTLDTAILAESIYHNWPGQLGFFAPDTGGFAGRYLIVTSDVYLDELAPFITHKTLQGFSVTVFSLESLAFVSCGNVRGAIDDWHQLGSEDTDHYCLLIGDYEEIPMCPSSTIAQDPGDDLYGSPADGDLDEEVYVGRLSVDDEADLVTQLDKILEYDLDVSGAHHGKVLLVAHEEDAPGKYEGAHEFVRNATYAVPPTFTPVYGSQSTGLATNAVVEQEIEFGDGQGIVAYRGHGSSNGWSAWNGFGQFHKNEILDLVTVGRSSIVWSLSCWNNNLDSAVGDVDCIGEAWMEKAQGGAVAHYGSTEVSDTSQNHLLDRFLFEAVFDRGLVRHGQAIAWAEKQMHSNDPGQNSWMYLLLGDPSMRIKRGAPKNLKLILPESVEVGGGVTGAPYVIKIVDGTGAPQPGVLVTLFKAGQPGTGGPDISANAYTNSNGEAPFTEFPMDIQGQIDVGASDPDGNQAFGVIDTSSGPWANIGGGLKGKKGKPVLTGEGPLTAVTPVSIELSSGKENATSVLFGSIGSQPVAFKGGTLVAHPWSLFVDFVSDGNGDIDLATVWPANVPSDIELWFQFAMQDDEAIYGVSLSNGLKAVTP